MKREIRFRAWNGNKYIAFDNHQYDLIYNDISGWNVCPNVPNYKGEWTTGESSSSAKTFKLEQFTGLKDKNGVEIYEGDIVKNKYGQGIVEYITEKCSYVIRWTNTVLDGYHSHFPIGIKSTEVIGNIHEPKT